MSARRATIWLLAALIVAALAFVAVGFRNATATPLVRRLNLTVANYPHKAAPLRIVLFSDVHVHGPDTPPSRVDRIVDQINGLRPDIVVGAGDFVGNMSIGHEYSIEESVEPLRRLSARFGVFAVLGNNDYRAGKDEVTAALERAGVRVLANEAVPVGPVALGGIKGRLYRYTELVTVRRQLYQDLADTPGIKILTAHRPDEFVAAPQFISLVLAGHTHCGQMVLPLIGPLETGSDFGDQFYCGVYRDRSKILVVTGGLGTSHLPLRIGAPPDIWLITIHGPEPEVTPMRRDHPPIGRAVRCGPDGVARARAGRPARPARRQQGQPQARLTNIKRDPHHRAYVRIGTHLT